MKLQICIKYLVYGAMLGSMVITGCSSSNTSEQAALEQVVPPQDVPAEAEESAQNAPDIEKIIQQAETHYAKGCDHYEQQQWALARQEFDTALETLLDADVDAETHYDLIKTYNRLFYKIHRLELEQDYLQGMLGEEDEESAEVPEMTASLDVPDEIPEDLTDMSAEPSQAIQEESVGEGEETVGDIFLDESDAVIMKYVKLFSNERSHYREGMERASMYLPMIREVLTEYKLPTELAYVCLVESNFRVDAVSPAGAVGLWQFVRSTARNYGLTIDKWVDERRDPEKSTEAAAKYLSDLYRMLGDWDLALAGYYMGEYRVHNAIGKYRTRDISELAKTRAFGNSAKNYVSRFKAAVLLAKNPQQYGVTVDVGHPLDYDTVEVEKGMQLRDIARRFHIEYHELRKLNPELRQATTPPGQGTYALKVPAGTGRIVIAQQASESSKASKPQASSPPASPAADPGQSFVYRVKRGDNLAKIAQQYKVDVHVLQRVNGISNPRYLQIGQKIQIPSSLVQNVDVITHTIQRGETLGAIANRYKVSVATLKAYNTIRNERRLQIGQLLRVPLSKSSMLANNQNTGKMLTYRVQRGDSLSKIASKFGVSVRQLQQWNNVKKGAVIYPGNRLKVWY
ncbi:LysM peptidoglycan-binding domain-containing protein [candidate division KSB3 bacterium]|uniref:LysM peptidoglycan-binding domain-containing protein n=1 Tax=candidate division KSB3 bacterium TaxID=2044937 RepID=A0A9D5JVY4_9BACT|nr:LysM peptidoglycan-binding domain-containing protein [candidate division KSB3 bacterium]MBD3325135.1 LysM peptidoglycan-binding domain-containing protein [candidate division KSB3 bacterium]